MSGTSLDGIDVALVEIVGEGFSQKVRPIAFRQSPYPGDVAQALLAISNADTHTGRIGQLNFLLGELYGEAVVDACKREGIPLERLELVGSHGQTIYHQAAPAEVCGRRIACTLQIGEPALIAEKTRTPVVADFRPADMAAGGQGAPLVPYVDYLLYRDAHINRAALNIGGIANITAIPAGAGSRAVTAFDTGPGNMVIDALATQFSGGRMRFDRDGEMARRGRVDEDLLAELLDAPYYRKPPPKSAGREQYGAGFAADLLRRGIAPDSLTATATALTARAILLGIERFVQPNMPLEQLIVSGGGWHNPEIMRQIQEGLPHTEILPSNAFGIDSDAKEAIAFAVLAYESFHNRPANLPSATGASRPVVLGKLARV